MPGCWTNSLRRWDRPSRLPEGGMSALAVSTPHGQGWRPGPVSVLRPYITKARRVLSSCRLPDAAARGYMQTVMTPARAPHRSGWQRPLAWRARRRPGVMCHGEQRDVRGAAAPAAVHDRHHSPSDCPDRRPYHNIQERGPYPGLRPGHFYIDLPVPCSHSHI